jgi:hypothetical protein
MNRLKVVYRAIAIVAFSCSQVLVSPAAKRDDERKLDARIRRESAKLERFSAARVEPDRMYLHTQASALLAEAKQNRNNSYRADRLAQAAGDLLDASERLAELAGPRNHDHDDENEERQRLARRLERAYFRLQQAEYFANQSAHSRAREIIRNAKMHYQHARKAYDSQQYGRSGLFASACFDLVDALEKLAQAQVRVPDPPRLK